MTRVGLGIALLALSANAASALVYDVDRIVGAGSVTGFIETDGTLGLLSETNILGWSFTIAAPNLAGGGLDLISSSDPGQTTLTGGVLSATADALVFDFGATGFLLFQGGGLPNFWCVEGSDALCSGSGSGGDVIGFPAGGGSLAQVSTQSGVAAISEARVDVVPLPASAALLAGALALLGLGAARRRG